MNAHFKANEMFSMSSGLELAMLNGMSRPKAVIGPLGEQLTVESLPAPSCNRWTPRRKAEVVAAVNGGLVTMGEALARYNLSLEEFAGWQRVADRHGIPGLRATRARRYNSRAQDDAAA